MPRLLDPLSIVTVSVGNLYEKLQCEKLVSERFPSPLLASYSVSYQVSNTWVSQVITTFGVLPQDTVKGSWEEKKRQHSTSTVYYLGPWGKER